MPQRTSSSLMRPFVVLALPGMYLLYKYNQYRQQQMETARRRVTERELMHLNTKIHITQGNILYKAWYSKKKTDKGQFEIPDTKPTVCNETCKRRDYKKPGILHKIKLKIIEGGTNFGTPFRLLKPEEPCKAVAIPDLPVPATPIPLPLPTPRPGLQVSILGADTRLGQYIAFLLKKCACLKKLRLYEAREEHNPASDLFGVVDDLCYINTNCLVQGFSGAKHELDRCLQNSDIVLMLDDACIRMNMSYEERFNCQAEMVKQYTDAIVTECPKAFIIVSVTPIDCMVPLIAETLKETGWYDPRKLLGSVAVPEMRASTIASRALSLEPSYIKVPCVGGTEGEALVPLFSKAVDFFDFTKENAEMMVRTIRDAPRMLSDDCGKHAAQLSEAHALARLVNSVAWALLCKDIPRVSGFVATNSTQCIAPTRFMANTVEIGNRGISKNFGLVKMSENEMVLLNLGLAELVKKQELVDDWYLKNRRKTSRLNECEVKLFFPKTYERFHECS